MRLVVLTLLLFNVAYFGWQQFAVAPVLNRVAVVAKEKKLLLASEVSARDAFLSADEIASQAPPEMGESLESVTEPPSVSHQTAAPDAVVQPHFRACYSIGPFLIVNDVSSTAKIFEKAEGVATQQRATAERNQVGYWVYIPPLESLQAARAILRDLQSREIRDVLIISEGVKANAISAGVYPAEGQAQERRDSIRTFGYQAEIDPLYRTQAQYWLDVELLKLQKIPDRLWQKVVRKFPNITQKQRSCE